MHASKALVPLLPALGQVTFTATADGFSVAAVGLPGVIVGTGLAVGLVAGVWWLVQNRRQRE